MEALFVVLIIFLILIQIFRPSVETTKEGKCLLFYGRKVRKYKILN